MSYRCCDPYLLRKNSRFNVAQCTLLPLSYDGFSLYISLCCFALLCPCEIRWKSHTETKKRNTAKNARKFALVKNVDTHTKRMVQIELNCNQLCSEPVRMDVIYENAFMLRSTTSRVQKLNYRHRKHIFRMAPRQSVKFFGVNNSWAEQIVRAHAMQHYSWHSIQLATKLLYIQFVQHHSQLMLFIKYNHSVFNNGSAGPFSWLFLCTERHTFSWVFLLNKFHLFFSCS